MFVSATISPRVEMLAKSYLTRPEKIVAEETTEEEALIDQALAVLVDKHGVPAESARQRLADAAGGARTSKTEVASGIVMSM